jgi:uncharacterized YccA/Bax inhibitor family protein
MPNPFRTSNPALNEKAFQGAAGVGIGEAMTVQGTVNKTGILLLCVIATSAWTWGLSHSPQPESAMPWMLGGVFGGLIAALATIFKPNWAPISAPIYALFEGLFLGGISAVLDKQYPGIAFHAIGLTFGVLAATGGIALFYLAEMVLGFFHISVPAINGSGIIGIGFSLFVVVIAALNLVLDFDMIETGARMNAPRYMEWYGAFGLMVTLVWLYLEMLRLLSKLQRRN